MKLFQLLSIISSNTKICIFDLEGLQLAESCIKENLNQNFYEEDVFCMNIGVLDGTPTLFITLQK